MVLAIDTMSTNGHVPIILPNRKYFSNNYNYQDTLCLFSVKKGILQDGALSFKVICRAGTKACRKKTDIVAYKDENTFIEYLWPFYLPIV